MNALRALNNTHPVMANEVKQALFLAVTLYKLFFSTSLHSRGKIAESIV